MQADVRKVFVGNKHPAKRGGQPLGKPRETWEHPWSTPNKPNFGVLNASIRITTASIVKAAQ